MKEPFATTKPARDPRLDFFRGLTMLIIFIAHVPANSWNAFIPARFGFSSGAELFVFCSGFASALAFGGSFLIVALVALAAAIDRLLGRTDLTQQFGPLLADPERALLGLATLTWQPDYLDILPMYLFILALVPAMMALRALHSTLPFAAVAALYALAWFTDIHLTGNPWNGAGWFLNPFAWQAIFFIGFFIAMKWLPVPRLGDRTLMLASAVILIASVPLCFWGILEHWPAMQELRDSILPGATEKTNLHPLRILHFLALAYVTLSLLDRRQTRLDGGAGHALILIGRQSLACFVMSIVLARLAAAASDAAGQDQVIVALINIAGFVGIFATTIAVGWFKGKPWAAAAREKPDDRDARPSRLAVHTRWREAS